MKYEMLKITLMSVNKTYITKHILHEQIKSNWMTVSRMRDEGENYMRIKSNLLSREGPGGAYDDTVARTMINLILSTVVLLDWAVRVERW